jgi:hypothetical protein
VMYLQSIHGNRVKWVAATKRVRELLNMRKVQSGCRPRAVRQSASFCAACLRSQRGRGDDPQLLARGYWRQCWRQWLLQQG